MKILRRHSFSPILDCLHWRPFKSKIDFKILLPLSEGLKLNFTSNSSKFQVFQTERISGYSLNFLKQEWGTEPRIRLLLCGINRADQGADTTSVFKGRLKIFFFNQAYSYFKLCLLFYCRRLRLLRIVLRCTQEAGCKILPPLRTRGKGAEKCYACFCRIVTHPPTLPQSKINALVAVNSGWTHWLFFWTSPSVHLSSSLFSTNKCVYREYSYLSVSPLYVHSYVPVFLSLFVFFLLSQLQIFCFLTEFCWIYCCD